MLIILVIISTASLSAQISLPYFDGFESPTASTDWSLNVGPAGGSLSNKWYISTAEYYAGSHSMLISNQQGNVASYANNSSTTVAYKEFLLPTGTYDLSFAWRCLGEGEKDGFYVCWVPASQNINSSAMGIPPTVKSTALTFAGGKKIVNGSTAWKVETTTITSTGANMKLVFVWDNDGANNNGPSACIDNIQIGVTTCVKPSNLHCSVVGSDVTFSWTGSSTSYEVEYRPYGSYTTTTINNVTTNQTRIADLPEGLYDFFVRGICGSDTTIWVSYNNVLIYRPESHCIDFVNFNAPGTLCTTGVFANPYKTVGVVDNGPESEQSSHTMHYRPGETDPRTGGGLTTVPDGEVVSVRLGNWDNGAKAESITYTYNVPANSNIIMLMNYAVVLEAPGHGADADPRFKMEILNESGQLIDARCGAANFWADVTMPGWTITSINNTKYVWKDWTTIGLNFTPYAGQTIKIRLTTYDCDWSAHCGYAYFTLSCAEAKLSGISCGAIATASVSAPDGFNYKWYKPAKPDVVVSDKKELGVSATDTATYNCDVIFKEDSTCRFTLVANLLPRNPKAQFSPKWEPKDCVNKMTFRNTSGVETERGLTGEKCTSHHWDFGDGRTSEEESPTLTFPNEGGKYNVKLCSGISDDMCVDTALVEVVVPPLLPSNDTLRKQICQGQVYPFNGKKYNKTGLYEFKGTNYGGCDSVVVLDLTVVEKLESEIFDTICAGESYTFNKNEFKKSGHYKATVVTLAGCDSLITLHLTVLDRVTFNYTVEPELSGPGTGKILVTDTLKGWTHSVNGVMGAPLEGLSAGVYKVIYYDEFGCPSETVNIEITRECLQLAVGLLPNICADDDLFTIPFTIKQGKYKSYNLRFDQNAKDAGFANVDSVEVVGGDATGGAIEVKLPSHDGLKTMKPGKYKMDIEFNDVLCEPFKVSVEFNVKYSHLIMEQKFNDVIALLAPDYNGGYAFTGYKWYKNGLLLPSEIGSYLYIGPTTKFELTDEYHVEVRRVGEADWVASCPLVPVEKTDETTYIQHNTVASGAPLYIGALHEKSVAQWWSISGQYIGKQQLNWPDDYINTPLQQGVYILKISSRERVETFKIVIK